MEVAWVATSWAKKSHLSRFGLQCECEWTLNYMGSIHGLDRLLWGVCMLSPCLCRFPLLLKTYTIDQDEWERVCNMCECGTIELTNWLIGYVYHPVHYLALSQPKMKSKSYQIQIKAIFSSCQVKEMLLIIFCVISRLESWGSNPSSHKCSLSCFLCDWEVVVSLGATVAVVYSLPPSTWNKWKQKKSFPQVCDRD